MSNTTQQIIHIVSEVVIIGGITAYFINKTNKLNDRIEELEMKLQEQNEIIVQHDNLLLKLLNNVNLLIEKSSKKHHDLPPVNLNSSKKVVIMVPSQNKVEEIIDDGNIFNNEANCSIHIPSTLSSIEELDFELEEELKELELEKNNNDI